MTTAGYYAARYPEPGERLVHVHAGTDELGRVYRAGLMINSGMPQFVAELSAVKLSSTPWAEQTRADRRNYERWQESPPVISGHHQGTRRAASTRPVAGHAATALPRCPPTPSSPMAPAILPPGDIASGATAGLRTQLAPTSGAMGYGVPAAIAASLVEPTRTVVCLAGDGDFLMNGAGACHGRAARRDASDHSSSTTACTAPYACTRSGNIRATRSAPNCTIPTSSRWRGPYGGLGERVDDTSDFAPALAKALRHIDSARQFALIELIVDPEMITPSRSLGEIRGERQLTRRAPGRRVAASASVAATPDFGHGPRELIHVFETAIHEAKRT